MLNLNITLNLTEINFVKKIYAKNYLSHEQDDHVQKNLRNLSINHTNQEEKDKI